jgi:CheY-like chemotaxis protein
MCHLCKLKNRLNNICKYLTLIKLHVEKCGNWNINIYQIQYSNKDHEMTESEQQSAPAPKEWHVMIVDDDEFQLEFTADLLDQLGVGNVTTANSGAEALAQLGRLKRRPDLMICDLYMPGMDGFDFMSHLSKLDFSGAIVIVSGQEKRVRYTASLVAQLGSFTFLGQFEKPIHKREMQSVLEKLNER